MKKPQLNRARLGAILNASPWIVQPGPQLQAYISPANTTLYGGAAGGGKSDLAIGLALTKHKRTLYIRREAVQLSPVVERIAEILGSRDGFNGTTKTWNLPGQRQIVFGGVPNETDTAKFQGSSRDLLVIDEAANLLESQVKFLMGWVRSSIKGQRCRTLLCSNPPTSADGLWLIEMFKPWLDANHENPAANGELRWFASIDGKDTEVASGDKFKHKGEIIRPMSRTFIQSKVTDNKFFANSGYISVLQSLPEPLRSQMLEGRFDVGLSDDEWALIASRDVESAMARWEEKDLPGPITAIGVDPSRGQDATVIAVRHGWYFAPLIVMENQQITGGMVAAKVIEILDGDLSIPVFVDSIGIGVSVVDHLQSFGVNVQPINGAARADEFATDLSGIVFFNNKRAESWWRLKELLSDSTSAQLALPPDPRLKSDLCAPRYTMNSRGALVEGKKEIIKRLGRSPDYGDAVVYAATRTATASNVTPINVVGMHSSSNSQGWRR